MGKVGRSVKNPIVKARVFAIKYLYIKGEEGGRSRAGQKAEQWAVKSDVWTRRRKCKSSYQCNNISWHLGLVSLEGAHAHAVANMGHWLDLEGWSSAIGWRDVIRASQGHGQSQQNPLLLAATATKGFSSSMMKNRRCRDLGLGRWSGLQHEPWAAGAG